jgi:hypothetical protein
MCQRRKVVYEVRQGDCKAQHLLSRSDQRNELTMIEEVKPKVLLLMYAAYIHIQGRFKAPPESHNESRVLLQ